MLLVKLIVLLLLGFVIVSLFSGLYFLVKDKGQTDRTVNALTLRIGLSILAIIIVMIAGATGVIQFNPSPLSRSAPTADDDQRNPPPASQGESRGTGGRTRIQSGS
ncbi:MAG: twin transmembrane helix small protein [Granulosicoccus sp.]|nr:twin transmembrane helix small protein [Granulosicoccus sp.]